MKNFVCRFELNIKFLVSVSVLAPDRRPEKLQYETKDDCIHLLYVFILVYTIMKKIVICIAIATFAVNNLFTMKTELFTIFNALILNGCPRPIGIAL
jgi:hypothetical protein